MLFGTAGKSMVWSFSPDGSGLLLAALPPGAFIGLGLLIAIRNHLTGHRGEPSGHEAAAGPETSHQSTR